MTVCFSVVCFFFVKQKTAYEMRISDWSSDVCSSDLAFVDQTDLWSKIETAAAEIGAVVDVMDTRPRVEHYSPGPNRMPSPGSKPDPERPNFYFGADHGRMERQVAVQISLTDRKSTRLNSSH